MLNKRSLNLLGFASCAGLMAYALFAQYQLNLEPCPLCIFQRVAVIALGVVFLVAGLHNPAQTGSRIYAAFITLAAAAGVGVAGRHVWLQNLPPDKVPACGPGLDFMLDAFPLTEVFSTVLSGSGECAKIIWSFLGLSMPAWVLIAVAALGVYGIVVNLRNWPAEN
ncbi:MAG: disulfide bond formation protein B [Gammaproteobacteria bacterium]|nr:disulfide bond formation protein B [Gammaproteobacteria bacterium]MDP6615789.1 disulfide bond formation protein B [Gammaproteobacteria bacterium]MDP6695525.1 disulfide bond formation protein B [Gammaproteobacteria bacterium]